CKVTACDDENRDVIVGKNILANQEGNFTYSFMIPQTRNDLLYADVKVGKKEYILGTAILA
ncbi:MAG: hypothetical protein KGH99_05670, partial [Thaumarchaeota archaeon]|nr:hypothetical protein [Nitrososphaerota archaeon]